MNFTTHSKPVAIDLFSGAGGTSLGFQMAGFRLLGAIEIEPDFVLTYKNNLNIEVTNANIRCLDPVVFRESLELRKNELDVLVGCPPCQGFTRMRNKQGVNDERNSLVLRYLDYVKEFLPVYAVFENVPGLIRTKHGQEFYEQLYDGLTRIGYNVVKYLLNAAEYGVAQHRRRVIAIAARDGSAPPPPVPTHGNPGSQEVLNGLRLPWKTVRDGIGNGRFPALRAGENGEHNGKYPNHIAPKTGDKVLDFIRMIPHNGGSRTDLPKEFWLDCHKNHVGHEDVYGRMEWDKPSNTLTTGCTNPSKGRFVHPEQDRAITPREAATLQGFPMEYRFYGAHISAQIGNAVPPPLAKSIAESLIQTL